jgi:flagellar hook assembly protein FlgD
MARVIADGREALTNHPNPFNPTTMFRFSLNRASDVTLRIYDVKGRLVASLADGYRGAGVQEVFWNGTNANGVAAPSGIYFARLVAGDEVQVRRIVLLK